MSDADLLDALCAHSGIVCAVGAGGKKTTLYRLLRVHPGTVAFTATTFTPGFPPDLPAEPVLDRSDRIVASVVAAAKRATKIAYACPSDKPNRYAGLSPAQVAECHVRGGFDLTLVKADGARMRLLKAPGEGEPNLVPRASTILGLVSARAVGLPLSSQHVHRPERIAAVTGATIGEPLAPLHLARLIASDDGLLHETGSARVIPVINMADNAGRRAAAMEAAHIALDLSDRYDRVVVAAMTADEAIVDVVMRRRT
ncbi:MAG: putative selenium-dependent hydroxylase accessory protein YqeC [Rhodanobacter sp.]|nr:MAG: putative selenium-dependent hydroxylase accessory protein YqeC [Rhodanobacter sp.]TAL96206.1 MAG: putative selenium-dependent hydroxylase accessory protein YqeC [Rhodanobacter sp.]TAM39107.1 MAG: putative selenium-dependent hydroxylase accessory protein YqeC [Rhodanobacter sp.]